LLGRGNLTWGEIVRATLKKVLRATSVEGHCLSVHGIRHTATTLVAGMSPRKAIKQGSPHVKFIGG